MSILVDKNTKLLVQGITGREGLFHTARMINIYTRQKTQNLHDSLKI
jgi:succinyl-CoA synthetase alpha subunit